ncbi:MAG: Wzz/FepE/Etk N-terminal domain-containing protein [Clostridia bacterium]
MEEIDIKEYIYVLWKNKAYVVIAVLVGIAVGLLYASFFVKPQYESTTSLVLSKPTTAAPQNGQASSITQNDILLNQKLVATYGEIVKSKSIATEVINKLELNISEENFMKCVNVSSKKDTELLEIKVRYSDSQTAADIANTLSDVFTAKVKEVYSIENVSVIDKAQPINKSVSISKIKVISISVILCVLLVCFILFLKVYFANTVITQEDVEKLLELPVIAIIPKMED